MEHRGSATLAQEIVRAPLPVEEVFRRTIDLATAVNRFHRQFRAHGGIEPASIVVTSSGVELTEPVMGRSGVTGYTAPEQLRNVMDARSDIFAFGAVVYEMATGWKAFAGDTPDELKTAINEKQPPPIATLRKDPATAGFYAALDRLVAGCLVKNPDQRRQRMQNVLVDLKLMAVVARTVSPAQSGLPILPAMPQPAPPAFEAPNPAAPHFAAEPATAAPSAAGFGEPPDLINLAGQKKRRTLVKIRLSSETQKRNWQRVFKAAAILAVAGLLALAGMVASGLLRKPTNQLGVLRFALPAPEQASYLSSPAISPDGRLLAFSAVSPEKKRRLWLRPLNSPKALPLPDTDEALAPFWSPDGKYIGFFARGKLKRIAVDGGVPVVLCETDGLAAGGTWSRDGVIVFGRSFYEGLYRVPAGGGDAARLTILDSGRGERAHLWPLFLPDGKHFLFYALSEQEKYNGIFVGSLDTGEARHLLTADTNAIYAEPAAAGSPARHGYLLFGHGHRLTAQPFDSVKLALNGEPFTVAAEINYLEFINLLPISASANGLLAYQSIDAPKRQLVWLDREGNQAGVLGAPGVYGQARISPDGRLVAVNRLSPDMETADIWLFDLKTNRPYQFTTEPTHEGAPIWSPDGKQLVYFSNPNGHFDLFRKGVGGASTEEPLFASGQDKYPNDWSADGRYLLFGSIGGSTNSDLWIQPMRGKGEPFVYLQTASSEGYAQFSPDGKWVAYQSDETGRAEVYVEPFPRAGAQSMRRQISTEGGGQPKWRGDGKEIYYIMGDGRMMAVTVSGALSPAAPRTLFQTRALPRTWNLYDATPDGLRFLVNTPLEWVSSSPIIVVANWTEGFRKP